MNKERIDSLFEVLNFGDVDEYKMYQEIQVFFSMEGYNGETLSNFMQDIEKSGLIDYFLSKAEENKKNKYIRGALCMLYDFISDDTILDKLIDTFLAVSSNIIGIILSSNLLILLLIKLPIILIKRIPFL